MGVSKISSEETLCQRTEEVQDIVEQMPTHWTNTIVFILMCIVITIFLFLYFVTYSDCVGGEISITSPKAPVRLLAQSAGRLHLICNNGRKIRKGMTIAYIECGADYNDILKLEKICASHNSVEELSIHENLMLGPLGDVYNDFILSYKNYIRVKCSKKYANLLASLINKKENNMVVCANIEKEEKMLYRTLQKRLLQLKTDSILLSVGAISMENLEEKQQIVDDLKRTMMELNTSYLNKISEIGGMNIEVAKIHITYDDELMTAYNTLQIKYNQLKNNLSQWKEAYLVVAPINGRLQYLGFWNENKHINLKDELFCILPEQNKIIGEQIILTESAGKVKKGQDVKIQLSEYPYVEYGILSGKVVDIANVSSNITRQGNIIQCYKVHISFPWGTTTNYGKELRLNYETKGYGRIILQKKRLIERLFDNLRMIEKES